MSEIPGTDQYVDTLAGIDPDILRAADPVSGDCEILDPGPMVAPLPYDGVVGTASIPTYGVTVEAPLWPETADAAGLPWWLWVAAAVVGYKLMKKK